MVYDLDNSIGRLVGMASRAIINRLNRNFEAAGIILTAEQWIVLVNVGHHEGECQQYFARFSGKDKTSIARLLVAMEEHGLIRREPDSADRRQNMIFLTPRGRALMDEATPVVESTLAEAVHGIDKSELDVCRRVLREIFENMSGCHN